MRSCLVDPLDVSMGSLWFPSVVFYDVLSVSFPPARASLSLSVPVPFSSGFGSRSIGRGSVGGGETRNRKTNPSDEASPIPSPVDVSVSDVCVRLLGDAPCLPTHLRR